MIVDRWSNPAVFFVGGETISTTPRLQFTEDELTAPSVKRAAHRAERASDKLEKAEKKIPTKKVLKKNRVLDEKTGKISTTLKFEEAKKRPPSKLTHDAASVPVTSVSVTAHRQVHENEDDNVGVESAHKLEETAEGAGRLAQSSRRSRKMKPYRNAAHAEAKADKANLDAIQKVAKSNDPQFHSNPLSRWQQKRAIKKEYAAAKRSGQDAASAGKLASSSAKRAAKSSEKTASFVRKNWKGIAVAGAILVVVLVMLGAVSSIVSLFGGGGGSGVAGTTYPIEDADMLAAEDKYSALEAELQSYLNNYERTHSYDEYRYDLDAIDHDPYVLISAVTAMAGGTWTADGIGGILQSLFDRQYILTENVVTETRYRTETRTGTQEVTNPETGEVTVEEYEYEVEVPYTYTICTVALENFNLSHVPVYAMSHDQLAMYAMYMGTLGNRPDLFPDSGYVDRYFNTHYDAYEIPAERLTDPRFAAMMEEARKYFLYPYVWGGSSPETSFDCSGFVSWVVNNCGVGWSIGRLGANGLRNICTAVSPSNARPGDLIFFQGTYDATGASHVGIYLGDGMMLHCGDPIQYANINTSYWQEHFLSYGRLPEP